MEVTLTLDIPVSRAIVDGHACLVIRTSDIAAGYAVLSTKTKAEPLKQDSRAYEVQLALQILGPATLAEVYNVLQADEMRCNKQQVGTALGYLRRKGLVDFNRNSHQYTLIRSAQEAA